MNDYALGVLNYKLTRCSTKEDFTKLKEDLIEMGPHFWNQSAKEIIKNAYITKFKD